MDIRNVSTLPQHNIASQSRRTGIFTAVKPQTSHYNFMFGNVCVIIIYTTFPCGDRGIRIVPP
jgi:hypothetical protein